MTQLAVFKEIDEKTYQRMDLPVQTLWVVTVGWLKEDTFNARVFHDNPGSISDLSNAGTVTCKPGNSYIKPRWPTENLQVVVVTYETDSLQVTQMVNTATGREVEYLVYEEFYSDTRDVKHKAIEPDMPLPAELLPDFLKGTVILAT